MPDNRSNPEEVTRLLNALSEGSQEAFDRLLPVIYDQLKQIARAHLHAGGYNKTIRTTDLVHEMYLKMRLQNPVDWQGRTHFYAVASRAMRQILVDYARYKNAAKRKTPDEGLTVRGSDNEFDLKIEDILSLNNALDVLSGLNDRLRKVVEYRFFGGMTEDEVAQVLGVTKRTVHRDWIKARVFLYEELFAEG